VRPVRLVPHTNLVADQPVNRLQPKHSRMRRIGKLPVEQAAGPIIRRREIALHDGHSSIRLQERLLEVDVETLPPSKRFSRWVDPLGIDSTEIALNLADQPPHLDRRLREAAARPR